MGSFARARLLASKVTGAFADYPDRYGVGGMGSVSFEDFSQEIRRKTPCSLRLLSSFVFILLLLFWVGGEWTFIFFRGFFLLFTLHPGWVSGLKGPFEYPQVPLLG